METYVTFFGNVELHSVWRHGPADDPSVAIEVRDGDGNKLRLHLDQATFALIADAAANAKPYEPEPRKIPAGDVKVGDHIRGIEHDFDGTVTHVVDDGLDYLDIKVTADDGEERAPFLHRSTPPTVIATGVRFAGATCQAPIASPDPSDPDVYRYVVTAQVVTINT
jgi:hypothetical protein